MTYVKNKRPKKKPAKRNWLKILPIAAIPILVVVTCLVKGKFFESTNTGVEESNDVPLFPSRAEAKEHCPHDTVVWLNTAGGDYNFNGKRWYSNATQGVYVCKKEAEEMSKKVPEGKI